MKIVYYLIGFILLIIAIGIASLFMLVQDVDYIKDLNIKKGDMVILKEKAMAEPYVTFKTKKEWFVGGDSLEVVLLSHMSPFADEEATETVSDDKEGLPPEYTIIEPGKSFEIVRIRHEQGFVNSYEVFLKSDRDDKLYMTLNYNFNYIFSNHSVK